MGAVWHVGLGGNLTLCVVVGVEGGCPGGFGRKGGGGMGE